MKFWKVLVIQEMYTGLTCRHPAPASYRADDADESCAEQHQRCRLRRGGDSVAAHTDEEGFLPTCHVAERRAEAELRPAVGNSRGVCARRGRRQAEEKAGIAGARERIGIDVGRTEAGGD